MHGIFSAFHYELVLSVHVLNLFQIIVFSSFCSSLFFSCFMSIVWKMLEKQVETRNILDKKSLTTWMKFGILAELTFLAGSYLGYRKLNHDIGEHYSIAVLKENCLICLWGLDKFQVYGFFFLNVIEFCLIQFFKFLKTSKGKMVFTLATDCNQQLSPLTVICLGFLM